MKQKRTSAALLAMISLCTALTGCAFRQTRNMSRAAARS